MKTPTQNGMIAQQQQKAMTAEQPKIATLKDLVSARKDQIGKVLPSVLPPEQFTRLVLNALMSTKHLSECDMTSFYNSVMT